jgi:hypothetical protein
MPEGALSLLMGLMRHCCCVFLETELSQALREFRVSGAGCDFQDVISAIASTSNVGRTSAAAFSVINNAVAQPPTKTSSPRIGLNNLAASARHPLDEKFPEWGESPYCTVGLKGTIRLSDLLTISTCSSRSSTTISIIGSVMRKWKNSCGMVRAGFASTPSAS